MAMNSPGRSSFLSSGAILCCWTQDGRADQTKRDLHGRSRTSVLPGRGGGPFIKYIDGLDAPETALSSK